MSEKRPAIDFLGNPIEVNDSIVFITTGRYHALKQGRVTKITNTMVAISYEGIVPRRNELGEWTKQTELQITRTVFSNVINITKLTGV